MSEGLRTGAGTIWRATQSCELRSADEVARMTSTNLPPCDELIEQDQS